VGQRGRSRHRRGVALGRGGKDFVAKNIDGWASSIGSSRSGPSSPGDTVSADGGTESDD
jgi:hypothetical protein